jgi:hypothetical protein
MDRATLERHLAQAEAQVAAAQERVRHQEQVVADLALQGTDIDIATRALGIFRHSLEMYLIDRDRIRRMLEEGSI